MPHGTWAVLPGQWRAGPTSAVLPHPTLPAVSTAALTEDLFQGLLLISSNSLKNFCFLYMTICFRERSEKINHTFSSLL